MNSLPRERVQLYLRAIFLAHVVLYGYFYLLYGAYYTLAGLLSGGQLTDYTGKPAGRDFVTFYAASALAERGEALAVYAVSQLHAMEQAVIGKAIEVWPWFYPPTFLLVIWPLALVPYGIAWALWSFLTLYGNVKVVRHIAPHPLTPWLVLGFPGVVDNFYYGQNACLTAALLGGGLFLVDRRPWLGGALLGLLTYKPQLAMLVPVALLAGRRGKALGSFVLTGGLFALMSALAFGLEPWSAFLGNLRTAGATFDQGSHWPKMVTIFGTARLLGASAALAGMLQMGATLAAFVLVAVSWHREWPMASKGPLLVLCTILATPYALEYDLTLLTLAFAWWGLGVWQEQRLGEEIWLMAFWVALCHKLVFVKTLHLPLYAVLWLGMLCFAIFLVPSFAPGITSERGREA